MLLAVVAPSGVYLLLWRSRPGYALRAVGFAPEAARYAGIRPRAQIMVSMALSGALAGLVGINEVAGVHGRLLLDFVAGAGFAGIAVSLIGRNHPVGIVLAALLFGALYQGGAELAFEIPGFSRDMVFTLQGLIVLFSGAMAQVAAPTLARAWAALQLAPGRRRRGRPRMDEVGLGTLLASTLRVSTPLILCALAGTLAERSGVIDLGLEGKMLLCAFAAGSVGAVTGSLALALLAALAVGVALSMLHGYACVSHRGDQVVMGMAITMTAAGLTVVLGIAWFKQGGQTPPLPDAVRLSPLVRRLAAAGARMPVVGPLLALGLLGHNAAGLRRLAAGAGVWWLLFRTRFGLRLRATGENPAMVDAAGVSVRRPALRRAGAERRAVRAGRRLPGAGAEPVVHART